MHFSKHLFLSYLEYKEKYNPLIANHEWYTMGQTVRHKGYSKITRIIFYKSFTPIAKFTINLLPSYI